MERRVCVSDGLIPWTEAINMGMVSSSWLGEGGGSDRSDMQIPVRPFDGRPRLAGFGVRIRCPSSIDVDKSRSLLKLCKSWLDA